MKATGKVRRVDDLGRVVIPRDIRLERQIGAGTPLDIYTEDEKIIFVPYRRDNEFTQLLESAFRLLGNKVFEEAEYPNASDRVEKMKGLLETLLNEATHY